MPAKIKIKWSANATVVGGPTVSIQDREIEVTAYDQLQVTVPGTTKLAAGTSSGTSSSGTSSPSPGTAPTSGGTAPGGAGTSSTTSSDVGKATVSVDPTSAEKMKFLLITSSVYDAKLTYNVKGGKDIALDQPQLLAGAGLAGVLGGSAEYFEFKNQLPDAAQVQIIVGRDDE